MNICRVNKSQQAMLGSGSQTIIQMYGDRFPFDTSVSGKVLVRTVLSYRNKQEGESIRMKLEVLKGICHRNIINVKSTQDPHPEASSGSLTVYYKHVAQMLTKTFFLSNKDSLRELNRQLIQMVIHLAKNGICTSFSEKRCGLVVSETGILLKYFLPITQIQISKEVSVLEKSIQIFRAKALQYLEKMQNSENQEILGVSQYSCKVETKEKIEQIEWFTSKVKARRETQPYLQFGTSQRKISNEGTEPQNRKFSNLRLTSSSRKKSQDSTTNSDTRLSSLKETMRNYRLRSQRKQFQESERKRFQSQQAFFSVTISHLRKRSQAALDLFRKFKLQRQYQMSQLRMIYSK